MYSLLSILTILIIISTVPIVSAEVMRGESSVPNWVKNTAGWWASEQIPDSAFIQGIQYLIKEGIMIVEIPTEIDSESAEEVPGWVKNTAGWWAEDKIHDTTFVSGIKYLIGKGIIVVMEPQVEEAKCNFKGKEVDCSLIEKDVVETNTFHMEVNGGSCTSCVNWAYVGKEYRFQIETYDEQHGKHIDGVAITAKIISKGGELRHHFGEVTTKDGVYKNSISIPSMDWYAGNILSITGEYFGVEKTIEKEFEVFKNIDASYHRANTGAGAGGCAEVPPVSVNDNDESETNPHGITFSKSGMKMFMVGNADKVFEYNLAQNNGTNAYCLANTTVSAFSLSLKNIKISESGNPTGIVFDPSGTKMFLVDKHPDKVYQYVVDVPWVVTSVNATASDSSHCDCNPIKFSITDQEKVAEGITFDPSGTKMFIVGAEGTNKGEVNTYNLAVPYLITSASHASVYTMSFTDANPTGIAFNNSGTKMFISDAGTDTIRAYALQVPYIISSNSTGDATNGFDEDGNPVRCVGGSFCGDTLSMSAVGNTVRDLWFDAPGTKLFVLEQSAKDVTVFKLSVPFLLSSATIVS